MTMLALTRRFTRYHSLLAACGREAAGGLERDAAAGRACLGEAASAASSAAAAGEAMTAEQAAAEALAPPPCAAHAACAQRTSP